ncbi:MAG TPA: hypothetical protein VGD08_08820 [Stellaceae bacterium]
MTTIGPASPQGRPAECSPATPIGLAALARMAFDGIDMNPLLERLIARVTSDSQDVASLLDLSTIELLFGRRENGLRLQMQALAAERLYRRPPTDAPVAAAAGGPDGLRLLAFMAPGDFMANTPLDFLLEGSDVRLDMLYVVPGRPLPAAIPEHDVAIVAVGESDENREVLGEIARLVAFWPRPVLNRPDRIARLSRDSAWALLRNAPGIAMPATARIGRSALERIGGGELPVEAIFDGGCAFPIIARPIGSHAGHGLVKLDDPAAVEAYLRERPEAEFYVSPFIDYSGPDALFRKYRIALIGGRPFASHMAISQHWMIHYLNAGMRESAEKRAEEACFMAEFDTGFARRHAAALRAVAERTGLEYVAIDCGETRDGDLLIFEIDVAMIVHSMDPPDLFPYKPPQMRKLFRAFDGMLREAAGRT